jgi:hypothetical protein
MSSEPAPFDTRQKASLLPEGAGKVPVLSPWKGLS